MTTNPPEFDPFCFKFRVSSDTLKRKQPASKPDCEPSPTGRHHFAHTECVYCAWDVS